MLNCPTCGRRITKTINGRLAVVSEENGEWCCTSCASARCRELHDTFAPGCDIEWHDIWDHAALVKFVRVSKP